MKVPIISVLFRDYPLLVLLSYRIPLITGIILILTAMVNIVAFQVLSEKHFAEYIASYDTGALTPNPEQLKAFVALSKLDKKTQEEYAQVIAELSNLSTSIENISKNPELYMTTGTGNSDEMLSIPFPKYTTGILDIRKFPLFNLRAFGEDSAEGQFVTGVLSGLLYVNLIWFLLILVFYFFWIRSIFLPVQSIIENLERIIGGKNFSSIRYTKKNEFFPLIVTINNLHKAISIQEKIRSDFLSDLSHEIRTPITAVKCYLDGIEDGMMTLDKKTISLLQSELTRLTDITSRIMDYEHLTRDTFDHIHVERFSVRSRTLPIVAEYTPQLEKNNQKIVVDFPRDTMTSMDSDMYVQILHNIFSNFIKYAGKDTTLLCRYEKRDKEYLFTFSDNGVGIPEDEMDFVKEKFYRIDKGRSQSDKSMGIGLAIVERIASLHHGNLTIQKNHPTGVIFEVRIGR
ncbi:MAG: HAMP domain-containing sensor histidine kinase [Candidatus Gracilibacteria bacterium]|nr:HAMP domain-containing sensor histidine kinase [Candidatus Gracilibacteria bacterium]